MSLSARLWARNAELAAAALAHPFVTGLADGTLPRALFAGYVAQDAFFLESFARGYALGAAHAADRAELDGYVDLLVGVREELRLHAGYARRWGIDLAGVQPLPATLAYTDFLLATAALARPGTTAAAMTPCLRLYAHLGQSLAGRVAPGSDYTGWVTTYADPGFEQLAGTLERLLDSAAESPPVQRAYRRAMQLELAFFDAAWAGGDPPRSGAGGAG